jgi:hypothetical protein
MKTLCYTIPMVLLACFSPAVGMAQEREVEYSHRAYIYVAAQDVNAQTEATCLDHVKNGLGSLVAADHLLGTMNRQPTTELMSELMFAKACYLATLPDKDAISHNVYLDMRAMTAETMVGHALTFIQKHGHWDQYAAEEVTESKPTK